MTGHSTTAQRRGRFGARACDAGGDGRDRRRRASGRARGGTERSRRAGSARRACAGFDLAATGWRSSPSAVRRTSPGTSSSTGHRGDDLQIGGLCDAGEEPAFRRRLARAGFGDDLTREQMEAARLLRVRPRSRGRADPRPRRRRRRAGDRAAKVSWPRCGSCNASRRSVTGRPKSSCGGSSAHERSQDPVRATARRRRSSPIRSRAPLAGMLDWMCARLPT